MSTSQRALILSLAAVLSLLSVAVGAEEPSAIGDLKPTVILVCIDGFRADYLQKFGPPNLQRLAARGALADGGMIPSFPTKTFPNHYTMVTGLYPAHHGITGNTIWDPDFNARFSMSDRSTVQDGRWWGGEPIWVPLEKRGDKTAPVFWPGSEARIQGIYASYWEPFKDEDKPAERTAKLFMLLDKPRAERPVFLTLYFWNVDSAGHDYGPHAPQTREAVLEADAAIGDLLAGLQRRGIENRVHIIVVADHGMAPLEKNQQVFLEDYVDPEALNIVEWSPVLMASAKDGNHERVYQQLKRLPHTSVYRSSELPARWRYQDSKRIPPIIAMVDEGWSITSRKRLEKWKPTGGNHGFDNSLMSMRGLFIAYGPAFRPGSRLASFENIHVYSLLAHLLRVKPAPNDGSLAVFRTVMKRTPARELQAASAAQ